MIRRNFLKDTIRIGAAAPFITSGWSFDHDSVEHLVILHTNDVHSRVEPFPMDGGRNAGMGGAARRSTLINEIRSKYDNVLLLDCGDIFQGTPYFNVFKGEIEIKLMSEMGYDAATIGNHDFDGGIDGLHAQLPNANFSFVISNYNMSDTIMNGKTYPYKIFQKGNTKIGVYGLGIELDGLVPKALYDNTQYEDPVKSALKYEALLKNEMGCDLVVCISHLGFRYRDNKISDSALAKLTSHTDIILGGHTHTFLREPVREKNAKGEEVIINQVGFGGILIGRLDVYFNQKKKKNVKHKNNIVVR
jgi:5'-nucleotidase